MLPCLSCVVIVACTSVEERQQNAIDTLSTVKSTASGTVIDVTENVDELLKVTEDAKKQIDSLVEGIEKRVQEVQSGAKMIKDGADAIRGE